MTFQGKCSCANSIPKRIHAKTGGDRISLGLRAEPGLSQPDLGDDHPMTDGLSDWRELNMIESYENACYEFPGLSADGSSNGTSEDTVLTPSDLLNFET